MPVKIQLRRGTAAQWTSANPVLTQGEIGAELDTGKFKIGDGSTAWGSLAYASGPAGPQGPTGADGPQGPAGADSTVPGPQGPQGDAGPQGTQGIQGVPGSDGAQGPQGIQGVKGDTGDTGAQGIQGDQGIQGIQGVPGADGATGAQGPAGPGVPAGGSTGQVLKKNSGTDYDTLWGTVTGGGSPGGSSGQAQYNDGAGGFAGAANVEIASGNLKLVGTSIPAAPGAGNLLVYSRSRAGRMFPEWIGPSGADTSFQAALFGNNVTMWLPGTGTTAAIAFGVSWTVAATQAHPAITNASLIAQMKRATYATSTTSGNAAGIRSSAVITWRGNAAGLGGFFFFARFGFVGVQPAAQYWIGLSGITTLLAGEPSAQNDTVCIGKDTGDTNLQLIFRDNTAATKVDLGVAPANNDVYDVMFFCPPNGSNITARVVRLNDGTVYANNTVHTANLPRNTIMLAAHAEGRTNAAAAVTIALNRIYVESDT